MNLLIEYILSITYIDYMRLSITCVYQLYQTHDYIKYMILSNSYSM